MVETFQIEKRKIPVKVTIKGLEKFGDFTFIVDTGAAHSIINADLLRTIGFTKNNEYKKELLSGFGGHAIEVPFLKVKSMMCLGLIRQNFTLGFFEFSYKAFYDGILGIDFFLEHKLSIDLKKGLISLD